MELKILFMVFANKQCTPCNTILPIIDEIRSMKVPVIDVAEDDWYSTAKYSVTSVPTVIVFKNDIIVDFIVGIKPRHRYMKHLDP